MTDIVEKLRNEHKETETRCCIMCLDAADEIERLRSALRRIGYDYVELSYDKVQWLYLEHIKIAKEAYQESFKE